MARQRKSRDEWSGEVDTACRDLDDAVRDLDGWLRGRLRNILRRRQHRRGRASGADHHRWPNAFFAEQGLYSLVLAHEQACQSSRR